MAENQETVTKPTQNEETSESMNQTGIEIELKNIRTSKSTESRRPPLMSYQEAKWGPYCGRRAGR